VKQQLGLSVQIGEAPLQYKCTAVRARSQKRTREFPVSVFCFRPEPVLANDAYFPLELAQPALSAAWIQLESHLLKTVWCQYTH
jgi:hypothetical protein